MFQDLVTYNNYAVCFFAIGNEQVELHRGMAAPCRDFRDEDVEIKYPYLT